MVTKIYETNSGVFYWVRRKLSTLHPCVHIAHCNMHTGIKKYHAYCAEFSTQKCKTSKHIPSHPWHASCLPQSAATIAITSHLLLLLLGLQQLLSVVVVLPPLHSPSSSPLICYSNCLSSTASVSDHCCLVSAAAILTVATYLLSTCLLQQLSPYCHLWSPLPYTAYPNRWLSSASVVTIIHHPAGHSPCPIDDAPHNITLHQPLLCPLHFGALCNWCKLPKNCTIQLYFWRTCQRLDAWHVIKPDC